ncbi:MAG: hypothetical protein B6U87_01375 [Candidatus Aenigmarchaeota archaeon ex4484_52]|nr:MAG: hypothetical protein B6U87_01375 [Candidatus Aenigmarchaeota archaeon ex4484_52]
MKIKNNEKGYLEKQYNEEELIEKKYLKVWMLMEVQSTSKQATQNALKKHIDSLKSNFDIIAIKENTTEIEEIEAGDDFKAKNINVLYSQINEMIFFINSYEKLMELIINYGPTSIEILAPEKICLDMRQAQNALIMVADMMHKFAAQGIGGLVIKT